MATYFNIVISVKDLIEKSFELIKKYEIYIYTEQIDKMKRWYEEIDTVSLDLKSFSKESYSNFFLTTEKRDISNSMILFVDEEPKFIQKNWISFYDDELFPYTIEVNGGRENENSIEILKFRILAKHPNDKISKFYSALQRQLKKDPELKSGLKIGNHFDKKLFYFPTTKKMLNTFREGGLEYYKE